MSKGEVRKKQIQYYSYCVGALLFLTFGKLIGNNGIVYLAIAMETMSLCMILIGDGVADAYTKMLRIRRKRGQYYDALTVTKRIRVIQAVLAVAFSTFVFLMAGTIALKLFQTPKASLVIRVLVPVIILRMISTLFTGYFQSFGAHSSMGIIYLLRQILFWTLGNVICKNRMIYGEKVAGLLKNNDYVGMYGALGLAIAMVITEVIVLVALIIYYFLMEHNYDKKKLDRNLHKAEPFGVTFRNFVYLNTNHVIFDLLKRFFVLVPFILLLSSADNAGVFYGKFLPLCGIPVLLMCSRYALLYSRLCSLIRNKDNRMTRENIQTGILYTWSVGLLITVLFSVMASQISDAFFEGDAIMKSYLQYGSVLIIAVTMLIYLVLVNIAHNRKLECIGTLFFTVVLDFILSKSMYHKMQKPEALIYAAIISLFIGCLVLTALTIFFYNLHMEYIPIYVLPLICVGVAGVIVLLLTKAMTPHIGSTISCILGFVLGTVIYVAALSLCRVFSDLEVERLYGPLGRKLFSFIFK